MNKTCRVDWEMLYAGAPLKIWMVALVTSLGFALESRADFIGHDMLLTQEGVPLFEGVLTDSGLQYGAEYLSNPMSADLTGSNLTLFLADPPTASLGGGGLIFTLSDLTYSNQVISDVTVHPASDIVGFTAADVSFNNENVFVNLAGLQIMGGQQAVLDFTFSGDPTPIVPEPNMSALLLAGLALVFRKHLRRALDLIKAGRADIVNDRPAS